MKKVIIAIIILLVIAIGVLVALKVVPMLNMKEDSIIQVPIGKQTETVEVIKEKKPVTWQGEERAIAVMIDNHKDAWPQGGLNDAAIVYEIIVEGGETRLMAVFKGKEVSKIGPVRSSRHYFLDYALENDAIYVHYGWSPQAQSDIKALSVNNINGITESTSAFWRTKDKVAPHNVATSTEEILKIAENKKYRTTTTAKSVLNYTAEEVDLEDGIEIEDVTIPHSTMQKVRYEYDSENKVFIRYARGKEQTDWESKEPVKVKNIIITFAENYTLQDKENKGRQGLKNIGTLKGYYITNGKYIEITCEKSARSAQTVYKDLEGNEIKVNDGNTFINICPLNAKVEFTEVKKPVETLDNTINNTIEGDSNE